MFSHLVKGWCRLPWLVWISWFVLSSHCLFRPRDFLLETMQITEAKRIKPQKKTQKTHIKQKQVVMRPLIQLSAVLLTYTCSLFLFFLLQRRLLPPCARTRSFALEGRRTANSPGQRRCFGAKRRGGIFPYVAFLRAFLFVCLTKPLRRAKLNITGG